MTSSPDRHVPAPSSRPLSQTRPPPFDGVFILSDCADYDLSADLLSSLALPSFTKQPEPWMTRHHYQEQYPSIRIQSPNHYPCDHAAYGDYANSSVPLYQHQTTHIPQGWQQMVQPGQQQQSVYNEPVHDHRRTQHARQPSDSTIASTGPASPYTQNTALPFIAPQDRSPPTTQYPCGGGGGHDGFPNGKTLDHFRVYQGYMPSQLSHSSAAHGALRDMSIDHHNAAGAEDVPDFISSRHSNSSHGHNTPSTPRTGTHDDSEDRSAKMPPNGSRRAPSNASRNGYSHLATAEYQRGPVELFRTESAACQDELYNPANFDAPPPPSQPSSTSAPAPAKPNNLLSPNANLVNERVRIANSQRSSSPTHHASREKSPFRQGSELAPPPSNYPRSPGGTAMPSAASLRQRQKEEADRKEFAAHQPALRREQTKTISPKDAFLDAPDYDHDTTISLFSDVIPQGYQKHFGGTETYPNNFISGTNQAFGQFVPMNASNVGGFRGGGVDLNNFLQSPLTSTTAGFTQPFGTQTSDKTPEFPAQLTSMESSASENPPASSQDSAQAPLKRPAESTVPDTPNKRTRRETPTQPSPPEASESESPSSDSQDAIGSGLSSSELLARNSQTGPHKCTRINPTTGKPCDTIFSRPYDLTRHEDTIHNRGKQKVRCQYCKEDKTFSRNDALTRHMRVVHPEIDFQGKRGRRDY